MLLDHTPTQVLSRTKFHDDNIMLFVSVRHPWRQSLRGWVVCFVTHSVIYISALPVPAGSAHNRVHPWNSLRVGGGPCSSWEEEHQESGVRSLPTTVGVESFIQPSRVGVSLDTVPAFHTSADEYSFVVDTSIFRWISPLIFFLFGGESFQKG